MKESAYLAALDRLSPNLQRLYLEQIRAIAAGASVGEIETMIERGDVDAIVNALGVGAFVALTEAIRGIYIEGGRMEMAALPRDAVRQALNRPGQPTIVTVRTYVEFDVNRIPSAEWLGSNAGELIRDITDGQRDAVREAMAGGSRRGQPPRQTALDIIGRTNPQTGRREGGIIGMSGAESEYVQNARDELGSGDKAEMRKYLRRGRRDKRFDRAVEKAIEEGRTLSQADIDKIAGRYADRLLQTRGEMISKAETLTAYNAGRDRAYAQLIEDGVDPDDIEKEWRTRQDEKVRNSHRPMNGQKQPLRGLFTTGGGYRMAYPGDSSHGAGYSEIAGCRCRLTYTIRSSAYGKSF